MNYADGLNCLDQLKDYVQTLLSSDNTEQYRGGGTLSMTEINEDVNKKTADHGEESKHGQQMRDCISSSEIIKENNKDDKLIVHCVNIEPGQDSDPVQNLSSFDLNLQESDQGCTVSFGNRIKNYSGKIILQILYLNMIM